MSGRLAVLKKVHVCRLLKNARMQVVDPAIRGGAEILRSEAYTQYVATTKDEGNAADGCFSATC
jgi:hypothetical protein